jgi:hypothetical protein
MKGWEGSDDEPDVDDASSFDEDGSDDQGAARDSRNDDDADNDGDESPPSGRQDEEEETAEGQQHNLHARKRGKAARSQDKPSRSKTGAQDSNKRENATPTKPPQQRTNHEKKTDGQIQDMLYNSEPEDTLDKDRLGTSGSKRPQEERATSSRASYRPWSPQRQRPYTTQSKLAQILDVSYVRSDDGLTWRCVCMFFSFLLRRCCFVLGMWCVCVCMYVCVCALF